MSTYIFILDKRNFARLKRRLGTKQPSCYYCGKVFEFKDTVFSLPSRQSEAKRKYLCERCFKKKKELDKDKSERE